MATTEKTAEYIVKTGVCSVGDIDARVPSQFTIMQQTTLNYKHEVFQSIVPTTKPIIQYFGLGIRGFRNVDDGIIARPYLPSNKELDLYQPIPIRCVPIDEDLSAADRAAYRMRKRVTVNGTPYFFYYLKKLTIIDTAVRVTQTNPLTNEQEPYEFSAADLNPTPPTSSTSGEQSGDTTRVNIGYRVGIEYTGAEVLEAINTIYGGDMGYARISEIGLYSGEDQQVLGRDANNVEFQYTESIYTQLCYKICNTGNTVTSASHKGNRQFLLGDGNLLLL